MVQFNIQNVVKGSTGFLLKEIKVIGEKEKGEITSRGSGLQCLLQAKIVFLYMLLPYSIYIFI
jgi:hypothetical protein